MTNDNSIPRVGKSASSGRIRQTPPKRRIGELLVEEGLTTEGQLTEALKVQEKRVVRLSKFLSHLVILE